MTLAMSSEVGTHWFKAPEFFNRGPDNKVRYHRNVDVYAVGLTFAAMLQAQSGSQLVPKVEGSLQDSETRIGIGFVAHERKVYGLSDLQIFKDNIEDNSTQKQLKSIIHDMTQISPAERLRASTVEHMLENLLLETAGSVSILPASINVPSKHTDRKTLHTVLLVPVFYLSLRFSCSTNCSIITARQLR